jgi:hypothetical protein
VKVPLNGWTAITLGWVAFTVIAMVAQFGPVLFSDADTLFMWFIGVTAFLFFIACSQLASRHGQSVYSSGAGSTGYMGADSADRGAGDGGGGDGG